MSTSASDKKYYLFRTVSEPRSKWLILTGAPADHTDNQLIWDFIPVVEKLLRADRAGFQGWHGQNLADPTPQQQKLLEPQLSEGRHDIEIGTVIFSHDAKANEPMITADYYVYAKDPIFVTQDQLQEVKSGRWIPWTAAVVSGVGVGALVDKKHLGLRIFAGGAAALLGAVLADRFGEQNVY